jgi:hypothetical protein
MQRPSSVCTQAGHTLRGACPSITGAARRAERRHVFRRYTAPQSPHEVDSAGAGAVLRTTGRPWLRVRR